MLDRFDPPAAVEVQYLDVPGNDRKVIVLEARPQEEARPCTFDGRPYQRVETTTSVMPRERYETLVLERAHARRRWKNQPAVDVRLEDLDHEEILQTRAAAIEKRRVSAGTSTDLGEVLDRLGLRRDDVITQAAQMLYGTRFLPDYPQAMLKMGRFRGTKITGDILDNKQEHLHAFALIREAMAWLDRTLPLAAHFPAARSSARIVCRCPPRRCARSCSTRSCTATTATRAATWRSRCSTIASRSAAWVRCRAGSAPTRCRARIGPCCATRSSRRHSTGRVRSRSGDAARTA